MKDFSQALLNKIDIIVENWIEAVRQDGQIESAKQLPYKAVRDSLPIVLQAIATMLSETEDSDIETLVQKSIEHGVLRAKQGYDAEEIAREYRLVRWVIFSTLEPDLLKGSSAEVIRACRLIDTALDEVIARCFKSYTDERLHDIEQVQSQLQLANQELTRLVRANKDNLSELAHELKTPLTSIIGYSDLFLRQQRQPNEPSDSLPNLGHIEKVLRNGRQLLHLINDALEISRYEAGKMQLHPTITDVRALIKNVIEIVEPLARSKDLDVLVECDRAPDEVMTDPLRLQQIVTNLLSNAIRYTKAGSIKLVCQLLPNNHWSISVTDTGIGINIEHQKQIFDPYFRVFPNDSPKQGLREQSYPANSTGLGLAIVSRLVKLLQGKIEVNSEMGVGSTFTVVLPLEVKISLDLEPQLNINK
ncbi:MAG: sensor histidine kinase [Aphanothece sp. CMT-3BRIN-NPC111]|jgi:signal transduction histidine kinase|nr:sensor histidine kinase [Aphanothece sp. CMT-3BRIN-NPC111]